MKTVSSRFRLKSVLGSGGFGTIYCAEDVTNGEEVAVKVQTDSAVPDVILTECAVYRVLAGAPGFPRVYEAGIDNGRHFIAMEELGKSISQLFSQCSHRFSMKTVLMLVDQMLSRVEFLHRKNRLHRDIKPSNFVMGLGSSSNQVHLIDFDLSSPVNEDQPIAFRGTPCYASISVQNGLAPSRRDDMESLGYVMTQLAKGTLPWHRSADKMSFIQTLEMKQTISVAELCHGLPKEFELYMESVRRLSANEHPAYAEYRKMFRDLFTSLGYVYDHKYDWMKSVTSHLSFEFSPNPMLAQTARVHAASYTQILLTHQRPGRMKKMIQKPSVRKLTHS